MIVISKQHRVRYCCHLIYQDDNKDNNKHNKENKNNNKDNKNNNKNNNNLL